MQLDGVRPFAPVTHNVKPRSSERGFRYSCSPSRGRRGALAEAVTIAPAGTAGVSSRTCPCFILYLSINHREGKITFHIVHCHKKQRRRWVYCSIQTGRSGEHCVGNYADRWRFRAYAERRFTPLSASPTASPAFRSATAPWLRLRRGRSRKSPRRS